jgi:hypothetical protein
MYPSASRAPTSVDGRHFRSQSASVPLVPAAASALPTRSDARAGHQTNAIESTRLCAPAVNLECTLHRLRSRLRLFSLRPNRDGGGSQAPKFRAGESAENLAETCDRFWTANCPGGRFSSMIHGVRFVARRSLIALCSLQIAASVTRAGTPVESPLAPFVAETRRELLPSGTAPEDRLAMIGNGYDALLLRVHLIRQATASIAIQTFIWTNDECGRLLIYELIEAARRGGERPPHRRPHVLRSGR